MSFAKIDTRILNSSLWVDRGIRDVFLTALLMALPYEVTEPMPQIKIDSLELTGFVVPPGWYGFVGAAVPGLIHAALVDPNEGREALRTLGEPDAESRSQEFDGRRLVRVDGGFVILNFMKYRDRDTTNADRQQRFRERRRQKQSESLEQATRLVMTQLDLTNARLKLVIQAGLQSQNREPQDTAKKMVKSYQDYLGLGRKGLLRYTWSPTKFFSEGHWANDGSWPIDKERMAELRRGSY